MNWLVRWGVLAGAVWLAGVVVPGVSTTGGYLNHIWVAGLFGLANAIVGNFIRLIAFPAMVVTLGLFSIVVNAWMLMLVGSLSNSLEVDGFWPALAAGAIIGLVSMAVGRLLRDRTSSAH